MHDSEPTRFGGDAWAPVAASDRSGFDESLHHGAGVVVDPGGRMRASIGDPELLVYARSAMKPLQATAMIELGLDLPADQLAVVTASHSGEEMHQEAVRRILDRHGLVEADLANTPSLPLGAAARDDALRNGLPASSLQQNCSGKHAGMLATCRINGWTIDDYLDDEHPLQQGIRSWAERHGVGVTRVGVDGCGAPAHVVRLVDLARVVGDLAHHPAEVAVAMSTHPELVGGSDRDVSIWMEAIAGLVAKEGAGGVMVLALSDGSGAALKIADGSDAARQVVTVEALRHLGVDVDREYAAVADAVAVPVRGHGRVVGRLRPLRWRRS